MHTHIHMHIVTYIYTHAHIIDYVAKSQDKEL